MKWSVTGFRNQVGTSPKFPVRKLRGLRSFSRLDDMGRRPKKADQKLSLLPKPTESARRRREYWVEFLGPLRLADPDIRVPTPNTLGNLWFNLRSRDLWVTVYAASSLGRIGVFLRGKPEYYGRIWANRKQIAAQIGVPLSWNPNHDHWSVAVSIKADPTNREDWPRQHMWLALRLNEFIATFKPFIGQAAKR
jgi:hypothetical protein